MVTVSNFNNISFRDWLLTRRGSLYEYAIEIENGVASLTIYSTTTSESDDEDGDEVTGYLEDFSYFDKQEAEQDIIAAQQEFHITFDSM